MNKDIFSLDKKVIVITGAAGLLGRMHAEAVASFGGFPVLLDINGDKVRELAREITEKFNVPASGMLVDITNEKEVSINCKKIVSEYKKIDGLVLNAANNPKVEQGETKDYSRLENFDLMHWNQDVAVGLTGAFLCSKYYGKEISKNPNGGSIVSISSDLGLIAPDQGLYKKDGVESNLQPVKPITYSVIKSGLIGLTRYLATYWIEEGVRSNAICPGGVENNQSKDFLDKIALRIPLKRMAKQNEYQGVLVWMLSDASSYLNGAIVPVDGGRTAW